MIGIKIEKNMDCNHICKQAEKIISEYLKEHSHHNIKNLMLVMQVKEVVDSNMDYTEKLTFTES